MREVRHIQVRQRCRRAVMLGVATAALLDIWHGAVQRVNIVELRPHITVTVQAARRHDFAAPRIDVTGHTPTAQLGVGGDTA